MTTFNYVTKAIEVCDYLKKALELIEGGCSFDDYQTVVPGIHHSSEHLVRLLQDMNLQPSLSESQARWFEEFFFPVLRPWAKTVDYMCQDFDWNDHLPAVDSLRARQILEPLAIIEQALERALDKLSTVDIQNVLDMLEEAYMVTNSYINDKPQEGVPTEVQVVEQLQTLVTLINKYIAGF